MIRLLTAIFGAMSVFGPALAQDADDYDPRARVSVDRESRTPDHISEIVGPAARTYAYEGSLEARRIYRMEANPEAGFQWPYFLLLPETVPEGTAVLVEPNNDGLWGAPFETHEYWAAIRNEQLIVDFGQHLNTPMLTPVFPRPLVEDGNGNLYIHALTRAAMEADDELRFRPDVPRSRR